MKNILKTLLEKLANTESEHLEEPQKQHKHKQLLSIESLASKTQISSIWDLKSSKYTGENTLCLRIYQENVRPESTNNKTPKLTDKFIKNLKNESAIIVNPTASHKIIQRFSQAMLYALQKREPFRLVFLRHKDFQIPENLSTYKADIADFYWTILTNPFSLVLDPTDWYQVRRK